MAYRKRAAKRPARKAARKGLKKSPTLYKAVKAVAKQQALAVQETKYAANFSNISPSVFRVYNQLISKLNAGSFNFLQPAIPVIGSGAASNNVVGQKVTLVKGYTRFHFNYIPGMSEPQDLIVKLFCLKSKQAKNLNLATTLPALDMLRNGSGGQLDFDPITNPVDPRHLANLPINTMAWTGFCKTFRFTKNKGQMNYDSSIVPPALGDTPNLSSLTNYHDFEWDWTDGVSVLKYDNSGVLSIPTNYCPMWGCVAYYPDGSPYPSGTNVAQIMPVEIVFSNHMWYKDA